MRASSFLGGICFLAKTLYHKGVGVLNFHLSLQNEINIKEISMKERLSFQTNLIIGSLLFGLFFGAGIS
jgi:hypothetical protein